MQVKVDILCHCISQWPKSVSSLKEALASVFHDTRDPKAGGDFGKCGHSSLTKQEHPLIFPPTGPVFPILRPQEASGITSLLQSTPPTHWLPSSPQLSLALLKGCRSNNTLMGKSTPNPKPHCPSSLATSWYPFPYTPLILSQLQHLSPPCLPSLHLVSETLEGTTSQLWKLWNLATFLPMFLQGIGIRTIKV